MKKTTLYCDLCKQEAFKLYEIILPNTPNHQLYGDGKHVNKRINPIKLEICEECCYEVSNAILYMKIQQSVDKHKEKENEQLEQDNN